MAMGAFSRKDQITYDRDILEPRDRPVAPRAPRPRQDHGFSAGDTINADVGKTSQHGPQGGPDPQPKESSDQIDWNTHPHKLRRGRGRETPSPCNHARKLN